MNESELIEAISDKTDMTKSDIDMAITAISRLKKAAKGQVDDGNGGVAAKSGLDALVAVSRIKAQDAGATLSGADKQ